MWFDGQRQPNTLYVASCSRGKDSTAMLRAIQLMGWPLDMIAAVDIWATDTIPAELPPMVAFKDDYDKKCLDWFGIPVTRLCAMKKCSQIDNVERERERERAEDESRMMTESVTHDGLTKSSFTKSTKNQEETTQFCRSMDSHSKKEVGVKTDLKEMFSTPLYRKVTYEELFYHVPKMRSKNVQVERKRDGKPYGFPYVKGNWCNSRLKLRAFEQLHCRISAHRNGKRWDGMVSRTQKSFSTQPLNEGQKINIVHYIGIAADEPIRIERYMKDPKNILPLVQIGWDEDLCGLEATYMDMLSPTYEGSCRDGCWFCHNQSVGQLRNLRKNYPDLWALLMKWDNDSPVSFKADGHTVHDFDRRFQLEDDGFIDPTQPFKWRMLDGELNYRLEGF